MELCDLGWWVLGGDGVCRLLSGCARDADTGKVWISGIGGGDLGLGLEESLRFRGPMALGARRAPPAALGAAGHSEPPPPQLSQSLRGERGGVRGAVKRRRGRQVSKIAALCALRSPDLQPVGGAPAYRAQPRPGPAANQLRISPRPTPD